MENIELQNWIEKMVDVKISTPLEDALSDGLLFSLLANRIKPNSFKIQGKPFGVFQKMVNLSNFIEFCKKIGVPEEELFVSVDLIEKKNLKAVETCLYSLSRNAVQRGFIQEDEGIGPKLSKRKSNESNDEDINNSDMLKMSNQSFEASKLQKNNNFNYYQ